MRCLAALAALILLCGGCRVGPDYSRPVAPATPAFKEPLPAGWKEATPADATIRGKWWEIYGDPQLSELEEQVSLNNQNLKAAAAQFGAARAAVRIARAALYPTLSGASNITNSRQPSNFAAGSAVSSPATIRSLYVLPFNFSYTPDLWSSIRRNITGTAETAQASAADLESARLLYQAEVAQDYFEIRGLDGDRQLLENSVKSFQEFLDLTKNRYAGGVASLGDVAQAETQLETTRAQLVDLGVDRAQFEHAIAILVGKPPSDVSIPAAILTAPPPPVPVDVPSALLERRPDIAAAERRVAAANEQIGIAQAAFYPNLTLAATGGLERANFLNWLTWPSHFWSLGPQFSELLFEGGRRRATISQQQDLYDATVATYRQTVLNAFQQVEDNLSALRVLAEEAGVQDRAVKSAEESLTISTNQYKGGIASYLQVITSQTIALQNQRTAIDLLTRRMVASVLLVEALGGGWNAAQLPTVSSLTQK